MEQIDTLLSRRLEMLLNTTNDISHNTNSWDSIFSGTITTITILAAISTIAGLYMLWREIRHRHYTIERQSLLLMDLFRHLFVNASILEALRVKTNGNWDKYRPNDGLFSKFCVLEDDLSLGGLQVLDSQFVRLHGFKLYLRNYNIIVSVAEKNFALKSIPVEEKNAELEEIMKRTQRLVEELLELGIVAGLFKGTIESPEKAQMRIAAFIKDYYKNSPGLLCSEELPNRTGVFAFFDSPSMGLKDVFDQSVLKHIDRIRILEY